MKTFFLMPLFLIISVTALTQCGTEVPRSHIINPPIVPNSDKEIISYNLDKTLSVHVWIVASSYNVYNWGLADYQADFDELNALFEPINLRFELCVEDTIPNYNYNNLGRIPDPDTGLTEWDEMQAQHYDDNVINVYYVDIIEDGAAGFATFPGGTDTMVLTKGSGIGTLSHEMGHFFGLYHTFETSLGPELVNGVGCESTGDLVCDTDANFPNSTYDGETCEFTDLSTDANGEYYTPQLNNWMSYFGGCRGHFTNGQFNRMAYIYLNERNYLW